MVMNPKQDIGNILFDDQKRINIPEHPYKYPDPEPNTEFENRLFSLLNHYASDGYRDLTLRTELTRILKELQKYKNLYPDDLIPNHAYAYRGIEITNNFLSKLMERIGNYEIDQFLNDHSWDDYYTLNYTYSSNSNLVESWTTEFDIAQSFGGDLQLIFKARIDKSFIFSDIMNGLIFFENELLRIPSGPLTCTAFLHYSLMDDLA